MHRGLGCKFAQTMHLPWLANNVSTGFFKVYRNFKGRGVYATRVFQKGELLAQYKGELVTEEEALRREAEREANEQTDQRCYLFFSPMGKWTAVKC